MARKINPKQLALSNNAADVLRGNNTLSPVTKGDVGLANVDNTSDANKPVSTAQAAADALKANLSGATFTGNIAAPNHLTTMSGFCAGKPANSEIVAGQVFPVATTITQANCSGQATVSATASTSFTIKRQSNGATVGTLTFGATAKLATVSITAGSVSAGEMLYIEAPATADGTLANIAFLVRA